MTIRKGSVRVWLLLIALILVIVLLPACDDDDEGETLTVTETAAVTTTEAAPTVTVTESAATTVTATSTVTETPTATETTRTTETRSIKNPDIFIEATIADVDSFDPAYGYDAASGEIVQTIYDPLIYYDGSSTSAFVPRLATEWTISPDGRTYRFKIREGVKFHNGNDLTPEDVEYSFERGMVQDYGQGPQWLFFEPFFGSAVHSSRSEDGSLMPLDQLTSAVEVDGQWVQFNLFTPYEPFMQILCGAWGSIVDKGWCIEQGDWDGTQASYEALNNPDVGTSPLHAIANGTGPFALERWDPSIEISLVRNDNYWDGPANFERFIYKIVDEWTTRKLELLAGDVDWAYVPTQYQSELEGAKGLLVYKDLPQLTHDTFYFQFDINPDSPFIGSGQLDGNGIPVDFFQDIDVRKGFAYAFDYDTFIADALQGEGTRVASPVLDGLPYQNPDTPMYDFDLAKAEEHLKKAWGGQVWENGFDFTITYNVGNDRRKIAAEILQANLFAINPEFKVGIQIQQFPTMLRGMYSGLLPGFVIGWQADYPDPHNFLFSNIHSNGTFSAWAHYSNPQVDALINQGINAASSEERQQIYYELQDLYYEDVPSFMIDQPLGRRYFRDWVKGFTFNVADPAQIGHVYDLSKEY